MSRSGQEERQRDRTAKIMFERFGYVIKEVSPLLFASRLNTQKSFEPTITPVDSCDLRYFVR